MTPDSSSSAAASDDPAPGEEPIADQQEPAPALAEPPESPPPERPSRSRAARLSFAVVSGYLLAIFSFYTNFFRTLMQATAALVDLLGIAFLIWIVARWWPRRGTAPAEVRATVITLGTAALCLALMAGITVTALHPPASSGVAADETCLYDVSAGVPIPLVGNGLIAETILVQAAQVNAIALVIGLDKSTSDVHRPHPVDLQVVVGNGGKPVPLHQRDIVDNGLTRFNFAEPVNLGGRTTPISVEVINKSDTDQIGVYVKVPDQADTTKGSADGVLIRGHAGQEATYRRPDLTLTGCIAGRA